MNDEIEKLVNDEVEKRLSDPGFLQDKLLSLSKRVSYLESENKILLPKGDFYDMVTESDEWMEMSAAVKLIGVKGYGRNNTFDLLRDRRILRFNNEPYQSYVERGYFKTIEQVYENPNTGETMINRKPMVSQKGLDFIRKIIEENN